MTTRFTLFQTAGLAMLAGLLSVAAHAQTPQCTTLKGTYAFVFSGMAVFPGAPGPVAFNGIGVQTFDGTGKFTATESANFGAFVLRNSSFSGTYTLNADCTGTATASFADGSKATQDLVVADGGKTIHAIGVDNMGPGGTLSTTFTRMPLIW